MLPHWWAHLKISAVLKSASTLATLVLLLLWPVLVASNWFVVLDTSSGYTQGLRIDYLMPKIWAISIANLGLVLLGLYHRHDFFKNWGRALIGAWLALGATQLFTNLPLNATLQWLQLTLGILSAQSLLFFLQDKKNQALFVAGIVSSVLLQIGVTLFQWNTQASLAGYWFFGEGNLSLAFGLARNSSHQILPYGTTAHPNVLAGVVVLLSILGLKILDSLRSNQDNQESSIVPIQAAQILVFATQVLVVWLTSSWSAGAAAGIFWGLELFKYLSRRPQSDRTSIISRPIFALLFFLAFCVSTVGLHPQVLSWTGINDNDSLARRSFLLEAGASSLWQTAPLGTGLSGFTDHLSKSITNYPEIVRFVQPVHNTFVLWIAETGFVGLLIILLITRNLLSSQKTLSQTFESILIILPILLWDHYLISLIPAWSLGWFFLLNQPKKVS